MICKKHALSHDIELQDIQVEAGPQDGTLLVTWSAVNRPPSSGPVTGYAVYADGKKVCVRKMNFTLLMYQIYADVLNHRTIEMLMMLVERY